MKPFNLSEWLKDKSRKVCTRDGNIAEIIYTNGKGRFPVIVIDPYEEETEPWQVTENGKLFYNGDDDKLDLFFADDEEKPQSIEIPFVAFDSEFVKGEYLIPEGCEARIDGNKVIIERVQKEEELTEFEKRFTELIRLWISGNTNPEENIIQARCDAKELLDLARKELEEKYRIIDKDDSDWEDGYKQGKQEALLDLPKWKKITKSEQNYLVYGYLSHNGYYLKLQELREKLPKEE